MKYVLKFSLVIWLVLAILLGFAYSQYAIASRQSREQYTTQMKQLDDQQQSLVAKQQLQQTQLASQLQQVDQYSALISDIDAYNRQLSASILATRKKLNVMLRRQQI